jgi:uncharacterized protein (TIGR00730 family)
VKNESSPISGGARATRESPEGRPAGAAIDPKKNPESTESREVVEAREAREAAIADFVARFCPGQDGEHFRNMIRTVCRLNADGTARADVKLMDRALAELRFAFKTFAPYEHIPKVSIFGSARTPEDHPDYLAALRFAERMRECEWMVITGAGDGIMKAGHGGAGAEASFGVAIRLPFEQRTNEFIALDKKLVNFNYFFTRKLMFIRESKAIALFPGGFGTQDEGFEALTLIQTGKAPMVPVVLIDAPGGTYWQHWRTYVKAELLHTGMISAEDMNLIKITDDIEVAVQEILRFYRRFHSYRYVRDTLVIRLNDSLPADFVAGLNADYADILEGGKIELGAALPEEGDELPEKPRLIMRFNRRSHGRLRKMLDAINAVDLPEAVAAR